MEQKLRQLREESLKAIGEVSALDALEALRVKYLGKKGELTAVLKQMGKLSAEERPVMGQLANQIREELTQAIENGRRTLSEKALEIELLKLHSAIRGAYEELAPHRICAYIYDVANAFNHFYHETKILMESDDERKKSYIALLLLTKGVLELCIGLLGFSAPERM